MSPSIALNNLLSASLAIVFVVDADCACAGSQIKNINTKLFYLVSAYFKPTTFFNPHRYIIIIIIEFLDSIQQVDVQKSEFLSSTPTTRISSINHRSENSRNNVINYSP